MPLPNESFNQTGAVRSSIVDNVNQQVTIIKVGGPATVLASTLTTILTYTALAKTLVPRIVVSGELPAKVFIVLNTTTIETRRMTSDRNVEFLYLYPLFMEIGDVLDVKIQHEFTLESGIYDVTLHGLPAVA
jgi:hypothetical protein